MKKHHSLNEAYIQTFSGKKINLLNPSIESICIEDIANALSMQCRFSGHCKSFYSVAQHSVYVSYLCDHNDALYGLLHDASEAYLVDIPKPLKMSGQFNVYLEFEKKMMETIYQYFNLPYKEPNSVMMADKIMLVTEARDIANATNLCEWSDVQPVPFKVESLGPEQAKNLFLDRFYQLSKGTIHEKR